MSQTSTFRQKGLKIIVRKTKNLFSFILLNEQTAQVFQSEQIQLKRISQQTINAAFDTNNPTITYDILQLQENCVSLTFRVKLDYLPEFSQEISLKKKNLDKNQIDKMQYIELQRQVSELQANLSEIQNANTNIAEEKGGHFRIQNDRIWESQLKKGNYIIHCSGAVVSSAMYNGEYEQNYDQYDGEYGMHSSTKSIICQLLVNEKPGQKLEQLLNFRDCYDYPFNFSFQLNLPQNSKVVVELYEKSQHMGLMADQSVVEIVQTKCI